MPVEEFKWGDSESDPKLIKNSAAQVQELRLDDLDDPDFEASGITKSSSDESLEVDDRPIEVPYSEPPEPPDQSHMEFRKFAAEASVFSDKYANPSIIAKVLSDKYGEEWLNWEPETLWRTISVDFGALPTHKVKEKIMVVALLMNRQEPWESWDTFQNVALVLNDREANFHLMQYISPAEIMKAISIMNSINPKKVGMEVAGYIAMICMNEGLTFLPEELSVAQEIMDMSGNDVELAKAVKDKFNSLDMSNLDSLELEEDPIGISVARLISIIRTARE